MRMLRGVADQAARRADLVHHVIAGVDAGRAGNAFVLQAVADVDAGRAHLHAQRAVDAVARALGRALTMPRGARRAAHRVDVVGNDQRVLIEHRALEARVRTHVLADLFAHEAGIAVGGKASTARSRTAPSRPASRTAAARQAANRHEVADERHAGQDRERPPQELLAALAQQLLRRSRAPDRASCAASGRPR